MVIGASEYNSPKRKSGIRRQRRRQRRSIRDFWGHYPPLSPPTQFKARDIHSDLKTSRLTAAFELRLVLNWMTRKSQQK